jgi:TIR domain
MTPGERITLITESARLLAMRELSEIDMILMQFDLPNNEDLGGDDRYAYALRMVRGATDPYVVRLHAFLVGDRKEVPVGTHSWTPGQVKLFVSHLAIHKHFVGEVREALQKDSVDAFVAHTTIEPSKEWQVVLEAALLTCDAMVVLLHKGFHESKWCDQEVGFGLARRLPTLPITIDEMPYGFMSKYQALPGRDLDARLLAFEITNWLVGVRALQPIMAESLVTALEGSRSYERSRRLTGLLGRLTKFTPEQLKRLSDAAEVNDQVRKANFRDGTSVPSSINTLITRHERNSAVAQATGVETSPMYATWRG